MEHTEGTMTEEFNPPALNNNIALDSNSVIASLPAQRYKIVNENGGYFTLMVCGESGLGKTTFINTLFQTTLKHSSGAQRRQGPIRRTVEIDVTRAELEEKGFQCRMNIIDTPGFGDNVNNNKAWQTVIDFIDDQHESYMHQEQQPFRKTKFDLRVHAVLYFIRPTGHGLKPIDIETMKRLSTRANLIPVIAKADTLTAQELSTFKLRIRQVIEAQQIRIFTPPMHSSSLDENSAAIEHARQLIEAMPFSVIGSEKKFDKGDGTQVVARKYHWGLAEVENDNHCDFRKLRSLLQRTYMLELISSTNEVHYETYRRMRLEGAGSDENLGSATNPYIPVKAAGRKLSHNPKFKEEENALKKYFTDQVKAEEQRFRQWEQNIVNERIRLNGDLEEMQGKVKRMEEEVRKLQMKKM